MVPLGVRVGGNGDHVLQLVNPFPESNEGPHSARCGARSCDAGAETEEMRGRWVPGGTVSTLCSR